MPHPDEGLIHEWLDGELSADEAARVEALVASDPEWAAAAAEARGLIAATSRIVGKLDDVPAGVIPGRGASGTTPMGTPMITSAPRRTAPWWMARVAALLLVVAGTTVVLRQRDPAQVMMQAAPTVVAPAPSLAPTPVIDSQTKPATAPVPTADATRSAKTATVAKKDVNVAAVPASPPPTVKSRVDQAMADAPSAVVASAPAPAAPPPPARQAVGGVANSAAEPRAMMAARAAAAPPPSAEAAKKASVSSVSSVVKCFAVQTPVSALGRIATIPPDSATQALWQSLGTTADRMIVNGDTLRTANSDTVRALAVRTTCPR